MLLGFANQTSHPSQTRHFYSESADIFFRKESEIRGQVTFKSAAAAQELQERGPCHAASQGRRSPVTGHTCRVHMMKDLQRKLSSLKELCLDFPHGMQCYSTGNKSGTQPLKYVVPLSDVSLAEVTRSDRAFFC